MIWERGWQNYGRRMRIKKPLVFVCENLIVNEWGNSIFFWREWITYDFVSEDKIRNEFYI